MGIIVFWPPRSPCLRITFLNLYLANVFSAEVMCHYMGCWRERR